MQHEMQRVLKRLYSLSTAMMRTDAAWEAYHREMAKVIASGMSNDELVATCLPQMLRVENTDFTRASEYLTMWLALMYVVVEGWRKWKFFDADVDRLLDNPLTTELKGYRHAIFHATEFDDDRVMSVIDTPERNEWHGALGNALRAALRDWNANLDARIETYLMRASL
jgi:hypothetical protein